MQLKLVLLVQSPGKGKKHLRHRTLNQVAVSADATVAKQGSLCVCVLVTNIICLCCTICSRNRHRKAQTTVTDSSSKSPPSEKKSVCSIQPQLRDKLQHVGLCTLRKEFPALEVVRLASALVAGGVLTRDAVHQVVVLRAGAVPTVAELRKVAGVHGLSARGSSNSELRPRRSRGEIEPSEIHSVFCKETPSSLTGHSPGSCRSSSRPHKLSRW